MSRRRKLQPVVFYCPKCGGDRITVIAAYRQPTKYKCRCGHVTAEPVRQPLSKSPYSRYAVRNATLKRMGFASYKDYLASDLWKSIRSRVMARDRGKCVCCAEPAISVHHITYGEPVLRGEDDSQLVAICRGCHKYTEFDGDEKLTETNRIARKLGKRTKKRDAVGQRLSEARYRSMRPRCRCCGKQHKRLGRSDICMGCYKSRRVLRFLNPQPQLANGLSRTNSRGASTATSGTFKDESSPGFVKPALPGNSGYSPVKVSAGPPANDLDEVFAERQNTHASSEGASPEGNLR